MKKTLSLDLDLDDYVNFVAVVQDALLTTATEYHDAAQQAAHKGMPESSKDMMAMHDALREAAGTVRIEP